MSHIKTFYSLSFFPYRGLNKQGYKCRREFFNHLYFYHIWSCCTLLASQIKLNLLMSFTQNAMRPFTRNASKKSLAGALEQQPTVVKLWWVELMFSNINSKQDVWWDTELHYFSSFESIVTEYSVLLYFRIHAVIWGSQLISNWVNVFVNTLILDHNRIQMQENRTGSCIQTESILDSYFNQWRCVLKYWKLNYILNLPSTHKQQTLFSICSHACPL